MKSKTMLVICRLLIATMFCLSFQSARAEMIGVAQVVSSHSGQADRAALLASLGRSEVAGQLQSMGIDPKAARDRVAAMTDEEVQTLAGRIDTLPAGANSNWGWGLAAVILVAAIVYYIYGWKR